MADERMTLSEHLARRHIAMAPEYAGGVAVILSRLGDVAAVIERELAHAALRDRLGYAGGTNLTGDQVNQRAPVLIGSAEEVALAEDFYRR